MKYLWLILSALVFSTDTVRATEQHAAIMAPIHALFDGLREGNGGKVRASFAEDAVMVRAHATLRLGSSPEAFAQALEQSEHVWDETIWDINIQVDDKLASVWTQFVFHLDGNLSHCGVNSFQLYKFDSGWKIIYLVDTFRQENCVSPPQN